MAKRSNAATSALLLALAGAGCGGYEPRPIDAAAVLRDLRAVRLEPRAAAEGLSVEEAVACAEARNPDLRALRRESGIAEGELVAAGLLENPELAVTWLYLESFTKGLASSGFDIAVSWAPPRPGETAAKEARAGARIAEVRALVAAEEWRLATDVRKACAALLAARERLALADASIALRERIRGLLARKVELGEASRLEASLLEIERAEGLRERAAAAAAGEEAALEVSRLLGLPPETGVRLRAGEDALAPRALAPTATAAALEEAMLARPDLAAAREEHEQAEQALRLSYIRRIPWLRLGPAFTRDELEGQMQSRFGVGLGIDLPLANLNEGEIAIGEARRERLRASFTAKVHRARAEVREALARLRAQERLLAIFEESARPALDASAALVEAGVASGDFDALQLAAVQDRALRGRRELVEARLGFWSALYDLERAVGARLPLESRKER